MNGRLFKFYHRPLEKDSEPAAPKLLMKVRQFRYCTVGLYTFFWTLLVSTYTHLRLKSVLSLTMTSITMFSLLFFLTPYPCNTMTGQTRRGTYGILILPALVFPTTSKSSSAHFLPCRNTQTHVCLSKM